MKNKDKNNKREPNQLTRLFPLVLLRRGRWHFNLLLTIDLVQSYILPTVYFMKDRNEMGTGASVTVAWTVINITFHVARFKTQLPIHNEKRK